MAYFTSGAYAFMLGVLCLEAAVLFVCLRLAFRKPYPVRWGRYRMGILVGFGLAACASGIAYIVRFTFGAGAEPIFHYVLPGAYIGASASWLFAFWREERPHGQGRADLEMIHRGINRLTKETEDAKRDLELFVSPMKGPLPT
jgi:hypothetical protein